MKKDYSYNCGRPIEKLTSPTMAEQMNLFHMLRTTGKVFRVDFVKRSTNEMRTMVCRFGVTKHLRGGKAAYNAGKKNLLVVWAFDRQGYRSIPMESVSIIKTGGIVYLFNTGLPAGDYPVADLQGHRTAPASTSPLLQNMPV